MAIKVIETVYRGYRFRSRLEARWAVFLDALCINWEYEPEGFHLSDGSKYLPDFRLPTFSGGIYLEVKPDDGDFAKAYQFVLDTKHSIWLAKGMPDTKVYEVLSWCEDEFCGRAKWDDELGYVGHVPHISSCVGIPNADKAWGDDRMFWEPGYEDRTGRVPENMHDCLGASYLHAVMTARRARFEYGEQG